MGWDPDLEMTTSILAIDPGASGGMAWIDQGLVFSCRMPDTEGDVFEKIQGLSTLPGPRVAVVENQVGVVGPGVRVSSAAMFKFGRGFGFLLGCLQALQWRIELVRPMKWQKEMSLGVKDNGWKNKLKAEAQRLFPCQKVTLKTADALLLLEWARKRQPAQTSWHPRLTYEKTSQR